MDQQNKAEMSKGERKREHILKCAIKVMAHYGIKGTTHRLIAREAEVPTSLTTYYFSSLDDLIIQAIDYYIDTARPRHIQVRDLVISGIKSMKAEGQSNKDCVKWVSRFLGDFLLHQFGITATAEDIQLEVALLYQTHPNPELAGRANKYRTLMVNYSAAVLTLLNSPCPETDAQIVIGTILRLEFEMSTAATAPSEESLRSQIERLLSVLIPE